MTVESRDPDATVEFVHVGTPRDLRESRRLAATPGLTSAGIEGAFWWDDGAEPKDVQHVFLLRHRGEAVATLCAREHVPEWGKPRWRSCALRGVATREREDAGCSYRLLLLLWSAQWLAAHRSVRALMAVCRTDALHRYTPLGFVTAGGWFVAAEHSCVAITAEASRVVETARELGLDRVLDSALAAAGGRAALCELTSTAA
jgi:hypothetical protein